MCIEIQYIYTVVNTIIVPKHSKWCFRFLFHLFNILQHKLIVGIYRTKRQTNKQILTLKGL